MPFGGCAGVCRFELGLFYAENSRRRQIALSESQGAASYSVCNCIGLSNWRAVCQLKRFICRMTTAKETASFVGLRGHCTVMAELRTFLRLEKGDAIFQLSYHGICMACRSFSTLAAQNVRGQRTKLLGSCLKRTPEREFCSSACTSNRTPYSHPPEASSVCTVQPQ